MEPEFSNMLPRNITVHTARIRLRRVTVRELTRMERDLTRATGELSDAGVVVIGYGCTSGSLVKGIGHDQRIVAKIERISNIPSVATAGSVVRALKALGAKKVAVATPYAKEINERERDFLTGNGFTVVDMKGLGLVNNAEIGIQDPAVAYSLARQLRHAKADAVLITCTNLRTVEVIQRLEEELGKPTISSNTATLWAMLRKVGIKTRVHGVGRLLAI